MPRRHQKAKPDLPQALPDDRKVRSILTPSAVSTSAEPDFEESARLPCLATGTPQPATTSALAVEMLKLPEESPPVPQVSMSREVRRSAPPWPA